MGWFEKSKHGIQKVNRVIAGIGACFLIPLMLITAIDVVSRDVFNHPIPATMEFSQYMLAVFILLGIAYNQQMRGYVEVSVFTSRLPLRVQQILSVIVSLMSLFLFSILAWRGYVIAMEERAVSDMVRIPQSPFKFLVAIAAFLMCLELLIDLGDTLMNLMRRTS